MLASVLLFVYFKIVTPWMGLIRCANIRFNSVTAAKALGFSAASPGPASIRSVSAKEIDRK